MLKKTITFKDLDGNDVTEDFYFNLSKAEIAELELSVKDGLTDYLEKIVAAENGAEIIRLFKEVIMMSVGKRSEDGRRFIKNQEIQDEFSQSDAYSVLFMELLTDAAKGAQFFADIVPADLREMVEAGKKVTDVPMPDPDVPAWFTEGRVPTEQELVGASAELLQEAFRRKSAAGS